MRQPRPKTLTRMPRSATRSSSIPPCLWTCAMGYTNPCHRHSGKPFGFHPVRRIRHPFSHAGNLRRSRRLAGGEPQDRLRLGRRQQLVRSFRRPICQQNRAPDQPCSQRQRHQSTRQLDVQGRIGISRDHWRTTPTSKKHPPTSEAAAPMIQAETIPSNSTPQPAAHAPAILSAAERHQWRGHAGGRRRLVRQAGRQPQAGLCGEIFCRLLAERLAGHDPN